MVTRFSGGSIATAPPSLNFCMQLCPPLEKWDVRKAVDLWRSDKTQRVNRKDARSTQSIQQSATQPDSDSSFA